MADHNLSSLGRALSQPQLNLSLEGSPEVSAPRGALTHPSRRRKLSSYNSLESLEQLTSPTTSEARVLVINTGGTIGMTLCDNGTCGKSHEASVSVARTARCLRVGIGTRFVTLARDVCNSKHELAEEITWGKSEDDDDVTDQYFTSCTRRDFKLMEFKDVARKTSSS